MKIAFLDFSKWDYNIETAYILPLSGTQSAVCFLAEALAQLGHEIYLFNHTSQEGKWRGVNCCKLPITDGDLWRSLDYLIIVSSAGFAAEMRRRVGDQTRIISWLHVDPNWPTLQNFNTISEINAIDAFIFVSEWQKQEFSQHYNLSAKPCYVLRNAIAPQFNNLFAPNDHILSHKIQPPILAYTSVPYRGLELLLEIFPKIRQAIPGTRLKIFSSMKIYQYSDSKENQLYGELYQRCFATPGVELKGSVSRTELAQELKSVTALTYPNTFPETSCIIAMEAMASGCQIITSDLGALRETVGDYGELISTNQISLFAMEKKWQVADDPAWQNYAQEFLERTLTILQQTKNNSALVNQKINQQVADINKFYNWSFRAQEWTEIFVKLGEHNQAELALETAKRYLESGNKTQAMDMAQQIIKERPHWGKVYEFIGLIYQQENLYQSAINAYTYAGKFSNNTILAMVNYGLIIANNGQIDAAINLWQNALTIHPASAEIHSFLGEGFGKKSHWEQAIYHYQKALAIQPNLPLVTAKLAEIYDHLFAAHLQQSNPELALEYLKKAQQIESTKWREIMSSFICPRIYQNQEEIYHWRQYLEAKIDQLPQINLAKFPIIPSIMDNHFIIPYQGLNDKEINIKIGQLYKNPHPPNLKISQDSNKIKIGFLSSHFYENSVTKCFGNIIKQLPPDQFEIYLLFSPYMEKRDRITEELKKVAHRELTLPTNLIKAMEIVANLHLNLLVYPEIGMESFVHILSLHRLAPVQCVLAGHPVTSGSQNIDYYISSELMEIDNAQTHYSETLIKLKSLTVDYDKPIIPKVIKNRTDFGLPENRHLYICPMTLIKIHPDFDQAIEQILTPDDQGEIIFFTYHSLEEKLKLRWQATLPDIQHRIKFLPFAESGDFINILMLADVVLDTFHFSGLNTALITMAIGTPIVTLPSNYLRGRFCYGVYQRIGIMECVTSSIEQYVKTALKIAKDINYRQKIKDKILQNNHVLYNNREALDEMVKLFIKLGKSGFSNK